MIHSARFNVILDANVIYPAPLRDFLLRLAEQGLYKPKWSAQIQNEWIRNLLKNRPDLQRESLIRTQKAMNLAFPDANVSGYDDLIGALSLPDPADRHILAAAIRGNVEVIVTYNLKHFPLSALGLYDIEAQHPDEFIINLISLDEEKALTALDKQVKSLKSPPQTILQVLDTLESSRLLKSVALLRTLLQQ